MSETTLQDSPNTGVTSKIDVKIWQDVIVQGVTTKLLIPYLRVSTPRQGESGLGLEAQIKAVKEYARSVGGRVVAVYEEIESGKKARRPELLKALAHARRIKGTLVVAKLDRLTRNVAFMCALLESGADFVCCDVPLANKLTMHLLAAVAEHETEMISQRTKAALAAYRARGGLLGAERPNCRLSKEKLKAGRKLGIIAKQAKAIRAYDDLMPMILEMRSRHVAYREIARVLTIHGHTTRNGKIWNGVLVRRVIRYYRRKIMWQKAGIMDDQLQLGAT